MAGRVVEAGLARVRDAVGSVGPGGVAFAAVAVLALALGALVWSLRGDAPPVSVDAAAPTPTTTAPTNPTPPPTSPTTDTPTPSPDPTRTPAATEAPTPTTTTSSPTTTPSTAASRSPDPPAEVRAVWVHLFDDTLKSPRSIDRMVDRVADAGANTLVVEVVRRQDAYYRSDVLPRTRDPQLAPGLDVLDRVVDRAQARGLSVHAWVPVLSAHHHVYDDLPRPDRWVWTDHGPDAPDGERWVTRLADGTWSDHLDPALPAVRRHVVDVMTEIATRYPVDGVHLDYVRYTSADAGYHPQALARFREQTGTTGTPAPGAAAWSDWRRTQVTALVRQVRTAVAEAAPGVAVTAAVIAQQDAPTSTRPFAATRGYSEYHQDWVRWTRDGLVDAAFVMTYFDQRTHGAEFAQWSDFLAWWDTQVDTLLVGGQAGFLNTPPDSLDQLARLRSAVDGVALYSYQQTTVSEPFDALLRHLSRGAWSGTAPVPDVLRR